MKKQKAIVNTTPTSPFDAIRRVENGQEYWLARELQKLLEYKEWRNFEKAIKQAQISCKVAGHEVSAHFVASNKIVQAGATSKPIKDYKLTRFACYSIAMNGDVNKPSIANAQTYFLAKAREAEVASSQPLLNSLWEQRLDLFHKYTKIPHGYWSIFGMVAAYCRADEFRNVHLVENALPDGSVGNHWCQFLREQGYDTTKFKKYPHWYPDKRGVRPANIYPNELLGEFWTWFNATYLVEHYPTYLKGRLASDAPQIESSNK